MNICCCGEVMVELAALEHSAAGEQSLYQRGFAGDTYNTAIYLSRAGLNVSYLTRLGDDTLSRDILETMLREGIDTTGVMRCKGREPGLYMIDNDKSGERFFSYWRSQAPVRQLFDETVDPAPLDAFFFSGITLAVTRSGHHNFLALLEQLRDQGTKVIFDPNYRPRLWDNPEQAISHVEAVLPLVDMALPTLEDETILWGIESVEACRDHMQGYGVGEVVIKGPDLTTHAFFEGTTVHKQAEVLEALDTTGAGDSFNAGYLASRLRGGDIESAIDKAQKLAARVVQHRGAILPPNES